MFAEAALNGAVGGTSGYSAQTALDEVRGRVHLLPVPATLQNIYDERRAELALEEDRFFDLIRTGQATAKLGSKGYIEGKHNVFPIPNQQIQLNHNLTQNNY
jgi:hypothetical protein